MSGSPERACLAIADISGYTGYLGGVELDHAQDILADVISTMVKAMAPFGLSKLEGDAAFMFLPGDEIDGSSLQDAIEGTYVAFQRRLRDIKQASSCECNACVRIPTLDLKFVVHHGAIARQTMLGSEELVGADVILVHRLLKNSVEQDTGIKAYVLYTQAALDAASIDPARQGLTEHHEPTDVAGDVTTWVRDLATRWQAELDRPPRTIDSNTQINSFTWEAPTPPSVTFDFLTAPAKRMLWDKTITSFDEDAASGRRGAGTTNHCLHGEDAVREEILEWRPPGYWLIKGFAASVPGEPSIYLSDELEALPDGGTRTTHRTGYVEDDSTDPELMQALVVEFDKGFLASTAALVEMLNVVAAESPAIEPAALPDSAARYLSEPVSG